MWKKSKSFTLIEVLVVVFILGLLASVIIVNVSTARAKGRDAKRLADVDAIRMALEMYYEANGMYPQEFNGWAAATGATYDATDNCNSVFPPYSDKRYQCLWDVLSADLAPYLSPLPKDPLNKKEGYRYYVDIQNERKGAIIKTKLEVDKQKMEEDSCPKGSQNYYDVIVGYFIGPVEYYGTAIGGEPDDLKANHCTGKEVGYTSPSL
uniref:Prepilin-type N-terminal cleavage/methylation domain-containing protein n=1 Tax=candidate division CPR3 bacterium TaxID=2268181 RepID=A0A7V3J9H4_UNCC3